MEVNITRQEILNNLLSAGADSKMNRWELLERLGLGAIHHTTKSFAWDNKELSKMSNDTLWDIYIKATAIDVIRSENDFYTLNDTYMENDLTNEQKHLILATMMVKDLSEVVGVDTDSCPDEFSILLRFIPDKLGEPLSDDLFYLWVLDTPIGRVLYEVEDGGFYAIHWKKGSLKVHQDKPLKLPPAADVPSILSPMEKKVADLMGADALMGQLVEEASEVIKAICKYNRANGHGQPTPVTLAEAEEMLVDELADVTLVCDELIDKLGVGNKVKEIRHNKVQRAYDRFMSKHK